MRVCTKALGESVTDHSPVVAPIGMSPESVLPVVEGAGAGTALPRFHVCGGEAK